MKRISGGQLSREAKPRFYQVTPAVLGRRRATQALPVRPKQSTQQSRVSPPPARGPTGRVGRHRPDAHHSDSDSSPFIAPRAATLQEWAAVGQSRRWRSFSLRADPPSFGLGRLSPYRIRPSNPRQSPPRPPWRASAASGMSITSARSSVTSDPNRRLRKNASTRMSGSTCACESNATTVRPVTCSTACV